MKSIASSIQRVGYYVYNPVKTLPITRIQFCILTEHEKIRLAEANIEHKEKFANGQPIPLGLFDPNMGTVSRSYDCFVCGLNYVECPGHFGLLDLGTYIFKFEYIDYVKTLLNFFCFSCSKILIDEDIITKIIKMQEKDRIKFIKETITPSSTFYCNHCGAIQPIITVKAKGRITYSYRSETTGKVSMIKNILTAEMVYEKFMRISNNDLKIIGINPKFSRPENLLIRYMLVPPPCLRYPLGGEKYKKPDDLDRLLSAVVESSLSLHNSKGTSRRIDDIINEISQAYNTLFSGSAKGGLTDLQGLKSIVERIGKKVGVIRYNLMGKRVEFAGRTVITGLPDLKISEASIPLSMAMGLTIEERVTNYNIDYLQGLVDNGATIYPGAGFVERAGTMINLKIVKIPIILEIGDIVHRHMIEDDVFMLNRQPSLHEHSMMCFKAKISPTAETISINLLICEPFNADFDGDEMNIHVPKTIQTAVEARMLANVERQILRPATGTNYGGFTFDALLGCYRITKYPIKLSRELIMNALTKNGTLPQIDFKNFKEMDGKSLLSLLLPPISLRKAGVEIKLGKITKGIINKKTMGTNGNNTIAQRICMDFSPSLMIDVLFNMQTAIDVILMEIGHTVSIQDLIITDETFKQKITKFLEDAYIGVAQLEQKVASNSLIVPQEFVPIEYLTSLISDELENGFSKVVASVEEYPITGNFFLDMALAGSKGKVSNVASMGFAIGFKSFQNSELRRSFGDRFLPVFTRYTLDPKNWGFIANSFVDGMDAIEFFTYGVVGRDSLIDTALATAESGYLNRKLNALLGVDYVEYDLTIRDTFGVIVQHLFGNCGFDPKYMLKYRLNICFKTRDEIEKEYFYSSTQKDEKEIIEKEKYTLFNLRDKLVRSYVYKRNVKSFDDNAISVYSPFGIQIILNYCLDNYEKFGIKSKPITLKCWYERIMKLVNELPKYFNNIGYQQKCEIYESSVLPIRLYILSELSSKNVLEKYKLDEGGFRWILDTILFNFQRAMIDAGRNIGCQSAQSISMNSTQMTLNTFHHAGVASMSARTTTGVPRLRELLHLTQTKKQKNPSMTIYLKKQYSPYRSSAQEIATAIKYLDVVNLLHSSGVYYEYIPMKKFAVKEDEIWAKEYLKHDIHVKSMKTNLSSWIIRLTFSRKKLYAEKVRLYEISFSITKKLKGIVTIINSSDTIPYPTIIIYFDKSKIMQSKGEFNVVSETLQKIRKDGIHIRGIDGIIDAIIPTNPVSFLRYSPATQDLEIGEDGKPGVKEWGVKTHGTNLVKILSSDIPYIDKRKIISNSPPEIFEVLGIEACRRLLTEEIVGVFGEDEIHPHHVELLTDNMTYLGFLISINRFGIAKGNYGELTRIAFEQAVQNIKDACFMGRHDDMAGLESNIMTGQLVPTGTGTKIGLQYNLDLMDKYFGEKDAQKGGGNLTKKIKKRKVIIDELKL